MPLILAGALAYRFISNYGDGLQGHPNREWGLRAVIVSCALGIAIAVLAVVTTI